MNNKKSVFWLLLFTASILFAQREVTIPGSQIRTINSSIVNRQEYELHILLPGTHNKSDRKYPVVYLMDSQWDFPLVKSIYGQQYYDGFIPELIVVGVTWGGINPNPDSLRARDYTPTQENHLPQSGGADKFLSFMKNELFPFMEANYKADPNQRIIMGCSLGGLITLYALFTQPDMFTGYIAASPAIGWDNQIIYKYEKSYFETSSKPTARSFISIGVVERGVPNFEKFTRHMKDRSYKNLNIESRVLEYTGHSGTKSETFSRGLQYAFQRGNIPLDDKLIKLYSGQYKLNNGSTVEINRVGNNLTLVFSSNNSFRLLADTSTDLYSLAEFLKLHFEVSNGVVKGFQLDRYNSSQFATKIN